MKALLIPVPLTKPPCDVQLTLSMEDATFLHTIFGKMNNVKLEDVLTKTNHGMPYPLGERAELKDKSFAYRLYSTLDAVIAR